MLESSYAYAKYEVKPRLFKIVASGDFFAALILAAVVSWMGPGPLSSKFTNGALVTGLLTYVAVALGFSVAGLTLVICNPSARVSSYLATGNTRENPPGTKNPGTFFGDLVFVYSWTSLVHWMFLMCSMLAYVFVNAEQPVRLMFDTALGRLSASATAGFVSYCVLRFLVAILTLSEFSQVYILYLRKEARDEEAEQAKRRVGTARSANFEALPSGEGEPTPRKTRPIQKKGNKRKR